MLSETSMHLHMRLKNCLQTILELEPALERLELGHVLLKDYATLRSFIEKLEQGRVAGGRRAAYRACHLQFS